MNSLNSSSRMLYLCIPFKTSHCSLRFGGKLYDWATRLHAILSLRKMGCQKAGDCVLMRSSDKDKPPYVARVENLPFDLKNNVNVRVRWYYRPKEWIGGRRQFHSTKELFPSDHTIEGKCVVHSFKNYTKLQSVGAEDYFCRFEYKGAYVGLTPDRITVYCKCEMPYHSDTLMIPCEGCTD